MARKGPPPAPCRAPEGRASEQAGRLSARDIAYRAALQAEIIADLRFQKSVEKLHRLGPRVLHVLLCEFAYDRMLQTEIERSGRALRCPEAGAAARGRRSICAGSNSSRLAAVNAHLGQPTETQLRRAEAATWSARLDANPARAVERSQMRPVSWKPITKGSLCGCATVELPIGLKLIDCAVFIGTNGAWAAALAKPQLDKEGRQRIGVDWKPSYSPVVEWRSCDLNDRCSAAVVAMVRAAHPEAVSGGFAS